MSAMTRSSGTLPSTLLVRLRAHEPDAWQKLTHLFGPLAYGWCRRAGLSPADAADVTQDIFRSVAVGLPRFRRDRPGDTFRGWLATIARSRINDFLRRQRRQPRGEGGTTFHQLVQSLPEELTDESSFVSDAAAERRGVLQRAMQLVQAEFETRTWTAFWRTAVEAEDPQLVAADLGVSLNAVYKAKSRVLKRLREELEGLFE
jgi:RNA polymerase sigma-70 factor (ECF subfamily)